MTYIVFSRRGKDWLCQQRIFAQVLRKLNTIHFASFLILSPAPTGDAPTHNTFDIDALCFAYHHNTVSESFLVLNDISEHIHINMNDMILH
ncbi:hypothetical protein D3C71_1733460 [compost metagenome]